MKNEIITDRKFWLTLFLSLISGLVILWIDSSPGWDDDGITAGLILIVSFLSGLYYPKRVWIWAILTGIWIPMKGIISKGELMFLIILVIPFAGSYIGMIMHRLLIKKY